MSALLQPLGRPLNWTVGLPLPVTLFVAAAGLRLSAFAVFYFGSVLQGHHGLVDPFDSVVIDRWAWYVAEHLRAGTLVDVRSSALEGTWDVGFTYLVAFEYTLVGHHPEVARGFNCLLAAITAPASYVASRQAGLSEKVSARAGWLVVCWPLSPYWTGFDLLKDPLVWFALSWALLAITAAGSTRRTMIGGLAAGSLYLVRNYMGPVTAVLVLVVGVLKRDWRSVIATLGVLAVIEAALLAAGFPGVWAIGPVETNGQATTSGSPSLGCNASGSGAACGQDTTFSQKGIALRFAVGVPTVLFGPGLKPLKDFLHPTLDWGMYPGLLVWMALIPFAALGLWRVFRRREVMLWGIALLAATIWGVLAVAYAGHALRQREMAFPAILILTSFGLERPRPRAWWPLYSLYWVAALGGLAWEAGLV